MQNPPGKPYKFRGNALERPGPGRPRNPPGAPDLCCLWTQACGALPVQRGDPSLLRVYVAEEGSSPCASRLCQPTFRSTGFCSLQATDGSSQYLRNQTGFGSYGGTGKTGAGPLQAVGDADSESPIRNRSCRKALHGGGSVKPAGCEHS